MTVNKYLVYLFAILLLTTPSWSEPPASAKEPAHIYQLDPAHSRLGFKVPHLGITSVSGHFKNFEGSLTFEGDALVSAQASIKVASVFTDNEKRDVHLKADDFFGEPSNPLITFKSNSVKLEGKNITVVGELTIKNVTKSITLTGTFGGVVFVEAWKVHKTGLSLKGKINRQDFGLKFNTLLGTGEAMVGDEVELVIDLEANRS